MKKRILTAITFFIACAVWAGRPADTDKDGKISIDEFLKMKQIQKKMTGKPFDEQAMRVLFNKKDQNQDGFLSKEELNTDVSKKIIRR